MKIISDEASVDPSARVSPFTVIGPGVVIEADVVVEEFVVIRPGARIGARSFIGTHSKIGSDAKLGTDVRITAYGEIRDNCIVGDRSTFGSRCTLSAGTIVGDDVVVKYGFVATDTPNLRASDKATCVLESGSEYGANVAIMPGVTIGSGAVIGACSQVRHDVGPGEVWFGNPAKRLR